MSLARVVVRSDGRCLWSARRSHRYSKTETSLPSRDELWLEVRDSMVSTQEHTVLRHPGYGKSLPTDEVYRFAHTRIPEEPDDALSFHLTKLSGPSISNCA